METQGADERKRKKKVLRQFVFWLSPAVGYFVSGALESKNRSGQAQ